MAPPRVLAVLAVATAALALGAAGCGVGPGSRADEGARLLVTRDYGATELHRTRDDDVRKGTTVIRLLDRHADVKTRYGGGFVQSIDGIAGRADGDRPRDWFFYVNGIESSQGSKQMDVHGGDSIWWDYRDWGDAMRVPGVVGQWPEPFDHGLGGKRFPARIDCLGADADCRASADALDREGIGANIALASARAGSETLRMVVGPWEKVREEEAAQGLESGPDVSGVFAVFERHGGAWAVDLLDERGGTRQTLRKGAGLVAVVGHEDSQPIWLVTGTDAAGVRAATRLLNARDLRDHFAVAVSGRGPVPVPVR